MSDKRRRRVPRQVREQQIIDMAVQVFARRGYHPASVDEIAELAGISKPMVYLYLDSKEGLFLACLRREAERLVAAFRKAARDVGPPELRLWAGLSAFFVFVTEHRDSWVVLHRQTSELSTAITAEVARARRAVMAEVTGLVRDGIAEATGSVRLGDEEADFGDFIEDSDAVVPVEAAAFTLLQQHLTEILAGLSDREQRILRLRFGMADGHPHTLEEVGREFGVTRERIRQIEAKTLAKLRHPSRAGTLRDFL